MLVFDEPTSGLDPAGRRELILTLADLSMTQLVITHDLPLALELCSRSVIMNGGRVVADVPTGYLLEDPDLLADNRLELPYGFDRSGEPRVSDPPSTDRSSGRSVVPVGDFEPGVSISTMVMRS